MFMISTVPEDGGFFVLSGKLNRNGEEVQKPEFVLAYNKAKKGVDVSDQMISYHTAFEIITGISVVNAFVLLQLGMYRISGSYPVIRLSGPFFTIRYPVIRYPDNCTFSCNKQL